MRYLAVGLIFTLYGVASVAAQVPPLPATVTTSGDPSAPTFSAELRGVVTDPDGNYIPDASVSVLSMNGGSGMSLQSDVTGAFVIRNLTASHTYKVVITASGFGEWDSPPLVLNPGEARDLGDVQMSVSTLETSVTAVFPEEVAAQQVKLEEKQRILGVIPNFYVVYEKDAMPMPPSLKFKLAIRAETDIVTFVGAGLLAGINQAADTPAFQQGAKGYAQRYGTAYAGGVSDILIGGAIMPSLLHQDPRYFYSGEGSTRDRVIHALKSVLFARGDTGKTEFNYSGITGDLASAALTNAYYPSQNRGAGLFLANWGVLSGGRVFNTLVQEFFLRHFTTHAHQQ
jgi:hypothetical protein